MNGKGYNTVEQIIRVILKNAKEIDDYRSKQHITYDKVASINSFITNNGERRYELAYRLH